MNEVEVKCYAEIVQQFPLRPIRLDAVARRIDALSDQGALASKEDDYNFRGIKRPRVLE